MTNPQRECARCGDMHTRKHPHCPKCSAAYKREWRDQGERCNPGTPPAPPPGFNLRDRHIGRPFG